MRNLMIPAILFVTGLLLAAQPKVVEEFNVRHNQRCEYFRNTKTGRLCGPNEGKACGICGG